jgi:hypothetical protein
LELLQSVAAAVAAASELVLYKELCSLSGHRHTHTLSLSLAKSFLLLFGGEQIQSLGSNHFSLLCCCCYQWNSATTGFMFKEEEEEEEEEDEYQSSELRKLVFMCGEEEEEYNKSKGRIIGRVFCHFMGAW